VSVRPAPRIIPVIEIPEAVMKNATLCFVLRERSPREVLLGLKKRGFGAGKLNGYGGKIRSGETLRAATVREVEEESTLVLDRDALVDAGTITFRFPFEPAFDHHVHVFTTSIWEGTPAETAEMAPSWHPVDRIPFERMWADDAHWLPLVLAGTRIDAHFTFAEDNETLSSWSIHEIGTERVVASG